MAIHTVQFKDGRTLRLDSDDESQRNILEQIQAQAMGHRKPEPIPGVAESLLFLAKWTWEEFIANPLARGERTFVNQVVGGVDNFLCDHFSPRDFSHNSPDLQRYRDMTPEEQWEAQQRGNIAFGQKLKEAYHSRLDDPNEGFTKQENETFEAYEARKAQLREGGYGDLFGNKITLTPEE